MRMRKRYLFCTSSHHNVPYEKQKKAQQGFWAFKWVFARARVQFLNMLFISTHLSVPHQENI